MKRITRAVLVSALVAGSLPALGAETIADAFMEGEWGLDFRYRLETVDQEPFSEDAAASTLRTRLNFKTADLEGFSAFIEFDYVAELGLDDFNAGGGNTPERSQYPVVADPKGEDLNQAYLQFQREGLRVRAGRQRIIYDNARFVGNVGWRQNPQTYDAFSLGYKLENGLDINWAFVDNVNRIFGNDVPAGDHDHQTNLVNVSKTFEGLGKLSAYYYAIDNEDVASLSNASLGLRFEGSRELESTRVAYTLEAAHQEDHGDNPTPYDANYLRLDLSFDVGAATLYAGFESLEGSAVQSGQAFRTPLATLHAFNGWADKFLATPDVGLEDTFVGVRGQSSGWSWNVLYHDYSAQSGPGGFGSEIDASVSRKFADHYGLLLKAAHFDGDSTAYGDTTKLWIQLTASFK